MLQFKIGVQLTITEPINKILQGVEGVYRGFQVPCVVTSGSDGVHSPQSKHYSHEALDFRIRNLKPHDRDALVQACQKVLGQGFDVVLEQNHLHVEFDPQPSKG